MILDKLSTSEYYWKVNDYSLKLVESLEGSNKYDFFPIFRKNNSFYIGSFTFSNNILW